MKSFREFLTEEESFVAHHTSFVNLMSVLHKDALIRGSTGFISVTTNQYFSKAPTVGLSGFGAEIVFKPSILKMAEFESYEYHRKL